MIGIKLGHLSKKEIENQIRILKIQKEKSDDEAEKRSYDDWINRYTKKYHALGY